MQHLYLRGQVLVIVFIITTGILRCQPLSGTYSIPGTVNGITVNNLTQLAALLNADIVSGTAIFEFNSGYTCNEEKYPVIFQQFAGTGNVIIRPAASVNTMLVTTGLTNSKAMIQLNGVSNLSFDGRPGGVGGIHWNFSDTTTVFNFYPVFQLVNGAVADTLQYLFVQDSNDDSLGAVSFGTSTVSGGNSNNVIQYDSIGNYSTAVYSGISSAGSPGINANGGNSILYNSIYNFQVKYSLSAGILIAGEGNGSNWNISGNSFYTTLQLSGACIEGINFVPGGGSTGNIISGNYIGGQAPLCGGLPWQQAAGQCLNDYFCSNLTGIFVDAGNAIISGNTMQNISLAGSANGYLSPQAVGIIIGNGDATVTGNLIGSDTVANSILNAYQGALVGIDNASSGNVFIDHNTIANLTVSQPPTSNPVADPVIGIYCYGVQAGYNNLLGNNTITNNRVFNLSTTNTEGSDYYTDYPIEAGGAGNLQGSTPVTGVCIQSFRGGGHNQTISGNTIYGLNVVYAQDLGIPVIYGIVMNADSGINTVNGNTIYGFWVSDNFARYASYAGLVGIYLPSGVPGSYNIFNNMIALGTKSTDGSSVINSFIVGIDDDYDNGEAMPIGFNIFHNSIYISGNDTTTYNKYLNSFGFARMYGFGLIKVATRDIVKCYNNIIYNNRHTLDGVNYGIGTVLTTTDSVFSWNSDYNLIYGTGNSFAYGNATDGANGGSGLVYANQAIWTARLRQDAHSQFLDPQFISPDSLTPNLHLQSTSPANEQGTPAFTVTYDFDSLIRTNYTPVDIGAAVVPGNCSPYPATISISASDTTICQGDTILFTTDENMGGPTPDYNFIVNGVSVQTGSDSALLTGSLNNGDSVWVVMTSSSSCVLPATDTSAKVVMVVNPLVKPMVTISASADTICTGTPVKFIATVTYGGTSPMYHFFEGIYSESYNDSGSYVAGIGYNLSDFDTFWVVVTSSYACAVPKTDTSNKMGLTVVQPTFSFPTVSQCGSASYLFNNNYIYETGYYYDTLTNVQGCDSFITLYYIKADSVEATFNDTICRNSTYNFNGRIIDTSGTYLDTIPTSYGCDSVVTLNMFVPPQPVITYLGSQLLYAGSYDSYQWLLNNNPISGANSQEYVMVQPGSYTVAVVDGPGCHDTSAPYVLVATEVEQSGWGAAMQLYPNPTSGELKIYITGLAPGGLVLHLFDLYGRQLFTDRQQISSGNYNSVLHLDELPVGVYFISVKSGNENYMRKVEVIK